MEKCPILSVACQMDDIKPTEDMDVKKGFAPTAKVSNLKQTRRLY